MKFGRTGRAAAYAAVAVMVAAPVAARKADSLRDLNGETAARARIELQRRGFALARGDRNDFSGTDYWWHRGDKDCVAVRMVRSRVSDIRDARASDCGEKGGGSDAALIAGAIGAVAIGALLLSRKDKDKHREQYQQDWQDVEATGTQSGRVRIFREPDKDARVVGEVREGERLRNYGCENTRGESWCEVTTIDRRISGWARDRYLRPVGGQGGSGSGGWGGSGGGSYPVGFSDLVGERVLGAENTLRQRGFRDVDRFASGRTDYTIWFRNESTQCIQMAATNDRVQDVVDIRAHPSCR